MGEHPTAEQENNLQDAERRFGTEDVAESRVSLIRKIVKLWHDVESKDRITVSLTMVQTVIAALMLGALFQSCLQTRQAERSLALSQKQFESTITPVIELAISDQDKKDKIQIQNRGIIPVSHIEIAGVLHTAYVNESSCNPVMHPYHLDVNHQTIHEGLLSQGEKVTFSVAKLMEDDNGIFEVAGGPYVFETLGIIIKYRRNADLTPFLKLYGLQIMRNSPSEAPAMLVDLFKVSTIAAGAIDDCQPERYRNLQKDLEKKLDEMAVSYK